MNNNPNHPQRLTPTAAPGALLKRLDGIHKRLQLREATGHDPVYLQRVRQCPCLKCAQEPAGEAAHVRMQSAAHNKRGGIGKKPDDRWTLPLCSEHHREQHNIGELRFWYDLGISPLLVCEKLYARRGDLVAMRAVIINAIAERG